MSSNKYVPTLAFVLLFTALIKAPKEKMPEMFSQLIEKPHVAIVLGWACAGIIFLSSITIIIIMRKLYMTEINRIASERDALQEKLNDHPGQHSRFKG